MLRVTLSRSACSIITAIGVARPYRPIQFASSKDAIQIEVENKEQDVENNDNTTESNEEVRTDEK